MGKRRSGAHASVGGEDVRMTCSRTSRNPHAEDWGASATHWRCSLSCGGRRMSVVFSMGSGHGGREPEVREVLDSLASDAAGYENAGGFDDWCGEYGYDADSRKAERTYKAVEKQAKLLRTFLGEDAYEKLLWHTERL